MVHSFFLLLETSACVSAPGAQGPQGLPLSGPPAPGRPYWKFHGGPLRPPLRCFLRRCCCSNKGAAAAASAAAFAAAASAAAAAFAAAASAAAAAAAAAAAGGP